MARSRLADDQDVVRESQRVDVRVRAPAGSRAARDGGAASEASSAKTQKYLIWWSALQITLAIAVVIMMSVWYVQFKGGFDWKNPEFPHGSFNYHPLFMVIAFMLLSGVADILYRMCRMHNKFRVKLAHGILQLTAFCFIVGALVGVWWYHDALGVPHLQSVHSWIGLTIVILVSLQWLVAFFGLLWPGFGSPARQNYLISHKFTGRVIFLLAMANILIGINKVVAGGTTMNVMALVVIAYAINAGYILAKNAFTREALEYNELEEPVTVYERRTSIHSNNGGRQQETERYVNISTAGAGTGSGTGGAIGQYQSLGEDPVVTEAMTVGRDTFNRFHERLEKRKALDVTGDIVNATTTTTVKD